MVTIYSMGYILRCEECAFYISMREPQGNIQCPNCRHEMDMGEIVPLDLARELMLLVNAMSSGLLPILEQLREE